MLSEINLFYIKNISTKYKFYELHPSDKMFSPLFDHVLLTALSYQPYLTPHILTLIFMLIFGKKVK